MGSARRGLRHDVANITQAVIGVAVAVGIFAYMIPKIASYRQAWDALQELSGGELAVLVGITLLNLATYWPPMVAAMPGLTLAQAAVNNQTSTAVANSLPGSGAIALGISYGMFKSWGFDNAAIGLYALVTGMWNNLVKFGMPVAAIALLAVEGRAEGSSARLRR